MSKKCEKKLTLEDLVARAEQSKSDKMQLREVDCEKLGGKLVFKKLPLAKVLSMMEAVDDSSSLKESLAFSAEMIYRHCPMLQDPALRESLEVTEPADVVFAVLGDDIGEINRLTSLALDFYGMGDGIRQQLKN